MPKSVIFLTVMDSFFLLALVVMAIAIITDPSFSSGLGSNKTTVVAGGLISGLLFAFGIGTTLFRSKWAVRIHYVLSALTIFAFPVGTFYALAYLIKLRENLSVFTARPVNTPSVTLSNNN